MNGMDQGQDEIRQYLKTIVHNTGLTKREREAWIEEMSAHIWEDATRLEGEHGKNDALDLALKNFGNPKTVRRQLSRQLVGIPTGLMYGIAGVFFALFVCNIALLMLSSTGEPMWQYYSIQSLASSPALMLGLALTTLMLRRTRCRRHRLTLLSIPVVYAVPWFLFHLTRIQMFWAMPNLVIPAYSRVLSFSLISYLLLFVWAVVLYVISRNAAISRFPIVLSIFLGLWQPVEYAVQYHLWQTTHLQVFWGHSDVFLTANVVGVVGPAVLSLMLIALLVPVFHWLDSRTVRRQQATG